MHFYLARRRAHVEPSSSLNGRRRERTRKLRYGESIVERLDNVIDMFEADR